MAKQQEKDIKNNKDYYKLTSQDENYYYYTLTCKTTSNTSITIGNNKHNTNIIHRND